MRDINVYSSKWTYLSIIYQTSSICAILGSAHVKVGPLFYIVSHFNCLYGLRVYVILNFKGSQLSN